MEAETIQKNGVSPKSHMNRANFFIIISFALLAVCSGCSKDDSEQSILGTWRSSSSSYTFKADKTGTFVLMDVNNFPATFTWTINGTKVEITRTSSTSLLMMATEMFFDSKTNTFYDPRMPSLRFTKQ